MKNMQNPNNPTKPDDNNEEEVSDEEKAESLAEGIEQLADMIRDNPDKFFGNLDKFGGKIFMVKGPDGEIHVANDAESLPPEVADEIRRRKEAQADREENMDLQTTGYINIPILRDEWIVRVVDIVHGPDDDEFNFSLEVFPVLDSGMIVTRNIDIYEIIDLIKNTAFINFILSSLTRANVWNPEYISVIASIESDDTYLRVVIPHANREPPEWISKIERDSPLDFQTTSEIHTIEVGGLNMVRNTVRFRHLYEPLIKYHVTSTLVSTSPKNFNTNPIDHALFYNLMIRDLLEDAVRSFYSTNEFGAYMLKHLGQLRTHLMVAIQKNTIDVIMYVSPGTIFLRDGLPRRYEYMGDFTHAISDGVYEDKPVKDMGKIQNNRYLIMDQIAMFQWTPRTQYYPTMLINSGSSLVDPNEEKTIWKTSGFVFNTGLIMTGFGSMVDSDQLVNFHRMESARCRELVKNYWLPNRENLKFNVMSTEMRLLGIVEVNLVEMIKMGLKSSDDILKYLIEKHDVSWLLDDRKKPFLKKEKNANLITSSLVLNNDVFRFMVATAVFNQT